MNPNTYMAMRLYEEIAKSVTVEVLPENEEVKSFNEIKTGTESQIEILSPVGKFNCFSASWNELATRRTTDRATNSQW